MEFLHKRIEVDMLMKSGDSFTINEVVSFTVNNEGDSDVLLSYKGGATLMKIAKGTGREFSGDSGYVYEGEMQLQFQGTNVGSVEVVKSVTSTRER